MSKTPVELLRMRMIAGAKRYAAADRSDPFALCVAMSQINNGIAGIRSSDSDMYGRGKGPKAGDAFFSVDSKRETMELAPGLEFSDGSRKWFEIGYRNQVRP